MFYQGLRKTFLLARHAALYRRSNALCSVRRRDRRSTLVLLLLHLRGLNHHGLELLSVALREQLLGVRLVAVEVRLELGDLDEVLDDSAASLEALDELVDEALVVLDAVAHVDLVHLLALLLLGKAAPKPQNPKLSCL